MNLKSIIMTKRANAGNSEKRQLQGIDHWQHVLLLANKHASATHSGVELHASAFECLFSHSCAEANFFNSLSIVAILITCCCRGQARSSKGGEKQDFLGGGGPGAGWWGGGVMLRCGLQRRSVSCLINGAASPRIANPKMALSTQSKPYPRYETIIWKPDNWNPQILNPNSRLKS